MKYAVLIAALAIACAYSADNVFAEEGALRIISLAPSTTEILFELGLGDSVVGVSTMCNYPSAALAKEKVGTFSQPDYEKIVSLKPTVVFATGLEQAFTVGKLKELGIRVVVSDPSDFNELFESIRKIARIGNKEAAAERLIRGMELELRSIDSRIALIPEQQRTTVFIEIWYQPLMTAGRNSFINDMVRRAGGRNIAYDSVRPYSYFSVEEIIRRDPACIIIGYMTKADNEAGIGNRLGWKDIAAVRDRRIYNDIPPDMLLRPGPRAAQAVEKIFKRLYPQETL